MTYVRRFGALAVLLAGAAFAAFPFPEPAEGASGKKQPLVRALVRPSKVRAGETFTVDVRGRRMKDAAAVAFHLVYDPALIVPVMSGSTEGPLLGRGDARTSLLVRAGSTGDRVILGIARLGSQGSSSGKGLICRLTFRALAEGTASLAFDQAQVTDPQGGALPATFRPVSVRVLPGQGGAD